MPKVAKELSATEVRRINRRGFHAVGGVTGLLLRVSPTDTRSWILRVTVGKKRRDIGLGGYPSVTLAQARERAREARRLIEEGIDPAERRKAAKLALVASQEAMTFKQATAAFLRVKQTEWRNPKHRDQWQSTLETYAFPVMGDLPVAKVELRHVVDTLEPIWTTRTETAKRLRGRIEHVLSWATVSGHRQGDNPARWKGHLDAVLPSPGKVAKVAHHSALPWEQIGDFMADLRQREGMAARALEFAILTAARSGEVRGATWDEIDLEGRCWTIPAERMKAGREHRVPLSDAAVTLLEALPRMEGSDHVFTAPRGGALSDMSLPAVCRRMKVDAVPHGFRSTFRDWCAERTNYPREVAELALAHSIGNAVEAAYRRGDLFAKRAKLMNDWARWCSTVPRVAQVSSIGEVRQ